MKRQFIIFSLLSFLIQSNYCHASEKLIDAKRFVLGLDLGVAKIESLGSSTKFQLGYSSFNYLPHQKVSYPARYGMSLGRKLKLNSSSHIIMGISYHQLSSMDINGSLEQGIFPPLYSANYQYTLQSSQLLAEAKVLYEWRPRVFPYFMAGVGGGFNAARHFITTVPEYLTVTPTFTDHSNSSLSYALGLGIDTLLSPNTTVGFGYLFSDLGEVGLGNGFIRTRSLQNYLNQSHSYINTILVQLSCYF